MKKYLTPILEWRELKETDVLTQSGEPGIYFDSQNWVNQEENIFG